MIRIVCNIILKLIVKTFYLRKWLKIQGQMYLIPKLVIFALNHAASSHCNETKRIKLTLFSSVFLLDSAPEERRWRQNYRRLLWHRNWPQSVIKTWWIRIYNLTLTSLLLHNLCFWSLLSSNIHSHTLSFNSLFFITFIKLCFISILML